MFNIFCIISLYSKKKLLPPLPPPLCENGPLNYEKTNSFRNTKFGIEIAYSIKMCKMPSSETNGEPADLKSSKVLYRLISKFVTTSQWNTGVLN